MKIFLLILSLALLTETSFAQKDTSFFNLLLKQMRREQRSGIIHYTSYMHPKVISGCGRSFDDANLNNIVWLDSNYSLNFTRQEREFIRQQFESFTTNTWPDQLFADSKVLPPDSINNHTIQLNKARHDSIRASGGQSDPTRLHQHRYKNFEFSPPIYLRDKRILIFYFMWYTRTGGTSDIWIYQKENDKWKGLGLIFNGAW